MTSTRAPRSASSPGKHRKGGQPGRSPKAGAPGRTGRTDRNARPGRPGAKNSTRFDSAAPAGRPGSGRPKKPRNARPEQRLAPPAGPANGFVKLGVPPILAGQLAAAGIAEPFPIQSATIPDALAGRDVLGRGQTGSGKTLAFGLPLITQLALRRPGGVDGEALPKGKKPRHGAVEKAKRNSGLPRGLVLVPTRELAMQVHDALDPLATAVGLRLGLVIGGASYDRQIRRLSQGVDIIVATPGRLEDLLGRGAADLSAVRVVVLDEADQMADMGFLPQVDALLERVPRTGQRLLFSATLDRGVGELVARHLREPVEHSSDPGTASVDTMTHRVLIVAGSQKAGVAAKVADSGRRTIVYVRTRTLVDEVSEQFTAAGLRADALHGGMSQRARSRALEGFRRGYTSVLVATDVAARGIHVDNIDLVLQMDPPNDHKDYIHRSGRTARAGGSGTVVTLSTPRQRRQVMRMLGTAGVTPEIEDTGRPAGQPRGQSRPGARPSGQRRTNGYKGGGNRSAAPTRVATTAS